MRSKGCRERGRGEGGTSKRTTERKVHGTRDEIRGLGARTRMDGRLSVRRWKRGRKGGRKRRRLDI